MESASSLTRRRIIAVVIGLLSGMYVAGRVHFHQWAHEIDIYRAGQDDGALVSALFETMHLIVRILIGGYGGYAVFRDIIGPMCRQLPVRPVKVETKEKTSVEQ